MTSKKYFGAVVEDEAKISMLVEETFDVEVENVFEDHEGNIGKEICEMQFDTTCDKIFLARFVVQDEQVVVISIERKS